MILLHVVNQRRPAGPRRTGATLAYGPRIGAYKRPPGGFVRLSLPVEMLELAGIDPEGTVAVYLTEDARMIRIAQRPHARRVLVDGETASVQVTSLFEAPAKASPMQSAIRVAGVGEIGWVDLFVPPDFPLRLPEVFEEVEWPTS